MNKRSLSLALLLSMISIVLFISCKKDMNADTTTPTPNSPFVIPAASPVTGSLTGLVVDEHNTPVTGAAVTFGSTTIGSDARGMFSFNHVTMDKYITTVTVTYPGYFKAFRSFSANASRNFVNIKLIPKTLSGTVSSNTAGDVSLTNGTSIAFQANSIVVKSTGAAYSGSVKVFASYIDPTRTDISAVVPGSFMGRDANNLYALQSTGMIAVDLESPTGEALQLKTGLPANIKLPIPASLQTKAPATIDTWSLNDQGIWQKEGTATKNGDHYEMTVTHFSFWNCDVPANAIYLNLHVQDQSGNLLSNAYVSLTIPNNNTWWSTTYGITDSAGNVSGLVPSGQALTMDIYPDILICNNSIPTQVIGPFTGNTSLTVTANIPASQELTISGSATDCNNQPLQHATAIIYTDVLGYYYTPVINGNYSLVLPMCTQVSSTSVTILDSTAGTVTNSANIPVTGNSVTIPPMAVCGPHNAVFTFGDAQGNCNAVVDGIYRVGTPLYYANEIGIMVTVTTPGAYTISTPTVNGFSFSYSGIFTTMGPQVVYMPSSGTPLAPGNFTFQSQSGGMSGCPVVVNVEAGPAVFSMGGPGTCNGAIVSGNYNVGIQLTNANTASITVDVTATGSYNIITAYPNDISFSDSGVFVNTGLQTVILHGTGTPANAGTFTYTTQSALGSPVTGCSFNVTTTNSGGNAVLNFTNSGGQCTNPVIAGTYSVNTPLNSSNTVTLMVDVTTAGNYSIQTNSQGGFSYSATGTFTSTGIQSVTLVGSGIPTHAGSYSFLPSAANSQGCLFSITVN